MINLDGLGWPIFIVTAVGSAAIYGWFSDKSKTLKENAFNIETTKRLNEERKQFEAKVRETALETKERLDYVTKMHLEFKKGYLNGRRWLAEFIGEADKSMDDSISNRLRNKKNPAYKGAEEVALAKAEKRELKKRLKFLEYQLKSYKEYFPFLEEYEDVILDESIPLSDPDKAMSDLENTDPVLKYVSKMDYQSMTSATRNQLALDKYLNSNLGKAGIGRFYERYVGYLYEKEGWSVTYNGIFEGLEDLGRDLICKRNNETIIIQAKCWSSSKIIHEKHIFQLFGTSQMYQMNLDSDNEVQAIFATTTLLSPVAIKAAEWLNIEVDYVALEKKYPIIKCNINQSSREKIYHLPFDQQYDKVKIQYSLGEFYATTVKEAEDAGFRRAKKWVS